MYSETDIESAVIAGVLSTDAANALRTHVASQRVTPLVDEENFRLLTGFNDIFVSIAGVLLLVGALWIGGTLHPVVGAAAVAALAWGLSEYFTRTRRMALPSILFLLAFVGGIFGVTWFLLAVVGRIFSGVSPAVLIDGLLINDNHNTENAIVLALAAACAVGAAYAHWRRFKVPVTIAAGAAAAAGVVTALLVAAVPAIETLILPLLLILGLCVFAFAMRWDMQDRERITRKSDVAFWLHLLAAPMIVHPIFSMLGVLDGNASIATAVIVVSLYIVMGIIALAVDRRALLVSALAYVVIALIALFREFGALSLNVAMAVFVIGSALLLLSAFWQHARAFILARLPKSVTGNLAVAAPATA